MTPPDGQRPASVARCVSLTASAVALVAVIVLARGLDVWLSGLLALAYVSEVWRRRQAQRDAIRGGRGDRGLRR